MEQKQLAMSSLVKYNGGPVRGDRRDSSCGRANRGGRRNKEEKKELKTRKSQIKRALVVVLYVRKVGAP